MTEGHGDDTYRYGRNIALNFSTNVYAGFDHAMLISHLTSVAECIGCYPEPTPSRVERLIAEHSHISSDCVMVTNGATEAIYLMAQSFRDARSAVMTPTFSEYEDACRINGHSVMSIDSVEAIPEGINVLWICNPNNPTGRVIPHDVLMDAIRSHSATVFIIDQAYFDYTDKSLISDSEAVSLSNVVLLGSLTKRFAIPGLRIGYAVGHPSLLSGIKAIRMPWSVNQLAIEGACYLLGHESDYSIDFRMLHSEAVRIGNVFEGMGIKVEPTDCNFILCELPFGKASELKDYLAGKHGILIRDASNFRGLTPRHFRVASLSKNANDILLKAIRDWLSSYRY